MHYRFVESWSLVRWRYNVLGSLIIVLYLQPALIFRNVENFAEKFFPEI